MTNRSLPRFLYQIIIGIALLVIGVIYVIDTIPVFGSSNIGHTMGIIMVLWGASSLLRTFHQYRSPQPTECHPVDLEKANEYQQVAALLSMDIKVLAKTVENNPEMAQQTIVELENRRQKIINDKEYREMRYNAMGVVHNIMANNTEK